MGIDERLKKIFESLQDLTTEKRNPKTRFIDTAPTVEILELINNEDQSVAASVGGQIPAIAEAVDLVVDSFRRGGRLLYFGAGTSGRLGILDAAECPPTFGADPAMVVGVIAGGRNTVFLSREGVEDDEKKGKDDVIENRVSETDTVIGITASRRTPYVMAALSGARALGASTVLITCNESAPLDVDAQINIIVGPEALAGSTRMKAATAQKMVLNMISTASMIAIGKVYENLMVDLKPASEKLVERAKGIIMMQTGIGYARASELFDESGRSVKTAILMAKLDLGRQEAESALAKADGFLARALGER